MIKMQFTITWHSANYAVNTAETESTFINTTHKHVCTVCKHGRPWA